MEATAKNFFYKNKNLQYKSLPITLIKKKKTIHTNGVLNVYILVTFSLNYKVYSSFIVATGARNGTIEKRTHSMVK